MATKRLKHYSKEIVGCVSEAPWFHLKEGNELRGFLLNVYEKPAWPDPSLRIKFYQVLTTKPTKAKSGVGKDAKFVSVPSKTVVNVNLVVTLQSLLGLIPEIQQGAVYYVHIRYGKKVSSVNRGLVHLMDVRTRLIVASADERRLVQVRKDMALLNGALKEISTITSGEVEHSKKSIRRLIRTLASEEKAIEEGRVLS